MKNQTGFTLIELIIFIVILGLLINSIVLTLRAVLINTPTLNQQMIAMQTARQCMEWFIGQRRINGASSLICPSTPSGTLCTAPSGYTISTSITCTTLSTDTTYKTITVTVSGNGNAVLTSLIGAI